MLRRIYDWTMELAERPHADWALAGVSFAESSFFPIPPDILLIPMVIAQRARALVLGLIASASSVLGGAFGYAIGLFLFATLGQWIVDFYGLHEAFAKFSDAYNEHGAWIVFTFGLTPLPYKLITIASGASGLNLGVFLLASIAARSMRFFAIAFLLYWFGPMIRNLIERYFGLATALFTILLIGGFAAVKYLL